MGPKFNLRVKDHVGVPDEKLFLNDLIFTEIASKYDFVTRALSFGRDSAWKRRMIEVLPKLQAPVCVDLACGTGDISFLLAQKYTNGIVVGLDLTPSMLQIATYRNSLTNVRFVQSDICALGLSSNSADVITGGYALRNAPDIRLAIDEIWRTLKPGGTAAFLDFSKPTSKAVQILEYWLLRTWGSVWGRLLHRSGEVYVYIAESLKTFPDRTSLRQLFLDHGFDFERSQLFYFGVLELLVVRKRS
jgi:ubiquinone/menaquinone biosynthesis methyltransferase